MYWRKRAVEARAIGADMVDSVSRAIMNDIAEQYEQLAEQQEKIERDMKVPRDGSR